MHSGKIIFKLHVKLCTIAMNQILHCEFQFVHALFVTKQACARTLPDATQPIGRVC